MFTSGPVKIYAFYIQSSTKIQILLFVHPPPILVTVESTYSYSYPCNTTLDFADNGWIPIDTNLDVLLKDLPWHPNLSLNRSTEYNNLVKEFNDKVCLLLIFI